MSFKTGRSAYRVAYALRPPLNCTLGIYVPIVTPKLYPIPGIIPILCITLWRRRYIAEPTQTKTFNCEICVSILTVIVKIWRYAICVVIASIVSYRTRYMVGNPPVLQVNKKHRVSFSNGDGISSENVHGLWIFARFWRIASIASCNCKIAWKNEVVDALTFLPGLQCILIIHNDLATILRHFEKPAIERQQSLKKSLVFFLSFKDFPMSKSLYFSFQNPC